MKKAVSLTTILLVVIFISIAGYLGYGSTMIDPGHEESIIKHLSTDKNKPINILSTQNYGDSFLVLYTDPVETDENKCSSHFSCFTKQKFYKSRYKYTGGTTGKQTEIMVSGIVLDHETTEEGTVVYAVANVASNETKCSVFEMDSETGDLISRLDVIDVPKGQPYIIVKEYKMQSKDNMIIVYDGDLSLKALTEE